MEETRIFLSHNKEDKDFVRKLAGNLALAGGQVWFDEWTIRPGDSIPKAIDGGLRDFDTFVLVWSEPASMSEWVRSELDSAFMRRVSEASYRLIPMVRDRTPLPPLLSPIKYIDATDEDCLRIARELLGIENDAQYRLAVQEVISGAGLEFEEIPGMGIFVCCPSCGAPPKKLKATKGTYRHGEYIDVTCDVCGWNDGGDI